jgi:hypothetical protein
VDIFFEIHCSAALAFRDLPTGIEDRKNGKIPCVPVDCLPGEWCSAPFLPS